MTKILFVCHGNICRSPMAEFVMKHLVHKAGRDSEFVIDSAATSTEEIGNGMHRGTVQKLREQGVPFTDHRARQITAADYEKYDYLIGMDEENIFNMSKEERAAHKIDTLPAYLYEAINYTRNSELVKKILGEHTFEKFIANKDIEWEHYRTHISSYEIERYLSTL